MALSHADGGVLLVGMTDDGTTQNRRLDQCTEDDLHGVLNTASDVGRYPLHELDGRTVVVVAVDRCPSVHRAALTLSRSRTSRRSERRPAAIAALGDAFEGLVDARLARFDDGGVDRRGAMALRGEAEAAGMPEIAAAASWAKLISH